PERARHGRHRQAAAVLRRHHERRVHGPDGRRARPRRRGRAVVGGYDQGVLRALQAGSRARQEGDGQREGRREDRRGVPGLRRRPAGAARAVRKVHRLLELSGLQVQAQPAGQRARRGSAHRRGVPHLQQADGHQARSLRQVHRVLGLSRVQDHQAGDPRNRVPAERLQRPAGRAAIAQGTHVLRLLGVSRMQLRRLAAAGGRAMPEVRGDVLDRARRARPPATDVRARGMRLQAGGRDYRRMKQPVTAYLRYLTVEKNASPHTLRSYRSDLADFERHLTATSGSVLDADVRAVRGWLAALHARGLDAASVARKLAAVRSLYRFLVRRHVVDRNPAREVRGPRLSRKLVGFLPIDEATAVLGARALGGASRARDVAILELLYATGLRVSELAGLDVEAIDREARTVRVLGKGRKERVVPYGGAAAQALDAYLGPRAATRGAVFVGARGGRLGVRSIRAIVARAARA